MRTKEKKFVKTFQVQGLSIVSSSSKWKFIANAVRVARKAIRWCAAPVHCIHTVWRGWDRHCWDDIQILRHISKVQRFYSCENSRDRAILVFRWPRTYSLSTSRIATLYVCVYKMGRYQNSTVSHPHHIACTRPRPRSISVLSPKIWGDEDEGMSATHSTRSWCKMGYIAVQ